MRTNTPSTASRRRTPATILAGALGLALFATLLQIGAASLSPPSKSAALALQSPQLQAAQKLIISSQGINVPKRPSIIAGLNHQFAGRPKPSNGSSPLGGQKVGGLLAAAVGPLGVLVGSGTGVVASKLKSQNATATSQSPVPLYLDRQQQQLLAANPTISNSLLTRSDQLLLDQQQQAPINSNQRQLLQQQATDGASPNNAGLPQHSYRGYSLIELEVKSELDRRYVQDLYANLSAALNEQAQRSSNLNPALSPYVDIDFWSFKSALNDQIDIMVSPKSRAFILNQLSRAKVKHRIKIDDIQTKLDQQQQPLSVSGAMGVSSELSGRQSAAATLTTAAGTGPGLGLSPAVADQLLNGRQQQTFSVSDPFAGTANANDSLFFENYQRLADINQYLESIVARARDVARVQVIGRSSQGRYLRVLRLGYEQSDLDGSTRPIDSGLSRRAAQAPEGASEFLSSNDDLGFSFATPAPVQVTGTAASSLIAEGLQGASPSKVQNASTILDQFLRRQQSVKKIGSIWFDGGTHAREWISPATVLYMSFRLAENHARCMRFFDHLKAAVKMHSSHRQNQQSYSHHSSAATRSTERGLEEMHSNQLDSELLDGINDINTSLLTAGSGGFARQRPRSELEETLELLAKRPQEVASEHACDLDLEQLLRRYTFYIMPVLNPDGYEYSHTHNRLWRKTRSTSNHPIYRHFCLGADPNRNYDARHGSTGSSSHPCSQTYGGTTPFTEPETRHQSNFVYAHRDTLKMFISFHSYSQMILLPYSHSKQLAPDHKDLESVGMAAVKAIEETHGTQYKVGASASILYTASGTASDWAYEKAGVKYSYTIELRDTGTFGFLLPRQQIVPTGEETFNGLLAMIRQMEINDHLLTSKSSSFANELSATSSGSQNSTIHSLDSSSTNGFVHAPDLDQLRPFGRFRPKPALLENAIDGSNTWATPVPALPGVRDRSPVLAAASLANTRAHAADGFDSEAVRAGSLNNELGPGDEVVSVASEEPDAGLAFEGEGELMEPTNNLSVSSALRGQSSDAAAESAAKLLGHIHAHSVNSGYSLTDSLRSLDLSGRRLTVASSSSQARQKLSNTQLGLSANGRSLINQPLLGPGRSTLNSHRRESSSSAVLG